MKLTQIITWFGVLAITILALITIRDHKAFANECARTNGVMVSGIAVRPWICIHGEHIRIQMRYF